MKQDIITKDIPTLTVGGGFMGISSLSEAATIAEQIGMILGALLVAITLLHRLFIFWRDARK